MTSSMDSGQTFPVKTQLLEYTSDVMKTVQDGKQCDTIVMDFSKASDKAGML